MSSLGINQEIFFDQSQFVSVVFSIFSLVFSCCLCILRNTAVWFYHLRQLLFRTYHSITKKSRAISCHSLFPVWERKQRRLLLNFVPTIDFTSPHFLVYEKRQLGVNLLGEFILLSHLFFKLNHLLIKFLNNTYSAQNALGNYINISISYFQSISFKCSTCFFLLCLNTPTWRFV